MSIQLLKEESAATFRAKLNENLKVQANEAILSRADAGKNLLDVNDPNVVIGSLLNVNGVETANALYAITGFIPIGDGEELIQSVSSGQYKHLYDANFDLIPATATTSNKVVGTTTGVYVRMSMRIDSVDLEDQQIESTSSQTASPTRATPVEIFTKNYSLEQALNEKLDKVEGSNLFNKDSTLNEDGFYFTSVYAKLVNASFFVSHPIKVTGGTTYYLSGLAGSVYHILLDSKRRFVASNNTYNGTITPTVDGFILLSGSVATKDACQFEVGASATAYKAYTDYKPFADLSDYVDDSLGSKVDKVLGKNLLDAFNPDSDGKFLNASGNESTNAAYYIKYIAVEPNTDYISQGTGVGGAYHCMFEADGTFVSNFKTDAFTTGANVYLVGLSCTVANRENQQLELGSTATAVESYTEYAPAGDMKKQVHDFAIRPILPNNLYFVKDFEICMYFENILNKQQNHPAEVNCGQGTHYSRLINFNFSSSVTGQTMDFNVNVAFKKGEKKTVNYDVVDPATNSGKTVNLLVIGDSYTDIGTYVDELTAQLVADGVTVNQIGTQGDSTRSAEGYSGGTLANSFLDNTSGVARLVAVTGVTVVPETGFPGVDYTDGNGDVWKIRGGAINGSGNGYLIVTNFQAVEADFATFPSSGTLTKNSGQSAFEGDATITYTSATPAFRNPFLNHSTGVLDITNYFTFWDAINGDFPDPTDIVIQFTENDLGEWGSDATVQAIVDNFVTAVDHIHTAYPTCRIYLSIEPFGSYYGNRNFTGNKYTIIKFIELLVETFDDDPAYNTFTTVVPSYAFVDLINGYNPNDVTPNALYPDITERSAGDKVHPSSVGMQEIGRAIYQVISNKI